MSGPPPFFSALTPQNLLRAPDFVYSSRSRTAAPSPVTLPPPQVTSQEWASWQQKWNERMRQMENTLQAQVAEKLALLGTDVAQQVGDFTSRQTRDLDAQGRVIDQKITGAQAALQTAAAKATESINEKVDALEQRIETVSQQANQAETRAQQALSSSNETWQKISQQLAQAETKASQAESRMQAIASKADTIEQKMNDDSKSFAEKTRVIDTKVTEAKRQIEDTLRIWGDHKSKMNELERGIKATTQKAEEATDIAQQILASAQELSTRLDVTVTDAVQKLENAEQKARASLKELDSMAKLASEARTAFVEANSVLALLNQEKNQLRSLLGATPSAAAKAVVGDSSSKGSASESSPAPTIAALEAKVDAQIATVERKLQELTSLDGALRQQIQRVSELLLSAPGSGTVASAASRGGGRNWYKVWRDRLVPVGDDQA